MMQNIDEYFKSLNLNCTPTGIKTLGEQRAINSRGVQMITISKPFSQKEKLSEIKKSRDNKVKAVSNASQYWRDGRQF